MLSNAISYLIKKIAIYWYKLIKKIGKKLKYIIMRTTKINTILLSLY